MYKARYRITPTLLENYHYYMKNFKTRQEFLDNLAKVKTKPTELMKKGIEFENLVKSYCERYLDLRFATLLPVYSQGNLIVENIPSVIKEIAHSVKDGFWQVTCKKEFQVEDQDYLLYGRCDVIKENTIYDIKYTQNYEIGKYYNSSQWRVYLYCTGMPNFSYLVSNGKDWWKEDYFAHSELEDEVKEKVWEFRNYLKNDKEAEKLYFDNWRTK